MAASRARRRLPISLICAQLRDHIRDLDCSPGRLGAAIDFILETARAGLVFVVEAQDRVDHRNAVVDGNSLQRVRHRPAQIVRMIRFAFKDHADGDNGVAAALLHRELAHNQRNFERARNLEQRGRDAGNQSAQLRNEVIDQRLHIGGVELAGYDWEMSFGGAKNARARGNQIRHGLLILQQARLGKTSNPQSRSPAALRALALFGTSRRKVGSRQRLDPQSRSPAALRALALLGTSRRKVGCRQRLDPQSRSPAALRALALLGTSRRKVGCRQRLDPQSRSPAALRALALLGTSRRKVACRQRRATTPASELEMRESFLRERLASVDLGFFAFRAAHAYANEDIVFQNVKRSTHAIRCPIGGIADALDFFRWPSLFLILFAQTLPLFLIALFLFHFAFVAAECVFPKIFRITRLGRCRIALRHREADRLVESLRVIETLRDPETAVGLFARFDVLDRRALNGLDFFGRN